MNDKVPSLFDVVDEILPVTPYRGTGGYVRRDTSQARAEEEVASGKLTERQTMVLALLRGAGEKGLTWFQLGKDLGLHHGQISGVLSNLHKDGRVFMLKDTREGSHPYVHGSIRDRFQDDQIYVAPVRTSINEIRDQLRRVVEAVELCRHRNFNFYEVQNLLAVVDEIGDV